MADPDEDHEDGGEQDAMSWFFGTRQLRPDHPDFWRLSDVLMQLDMGLDPRNPPENADEVWAARVEEIVDKDSLLYMAAQRVMMAFGKPQTKQHAQTMAPIVALWVDAFMAGAAFQNSRTPEVS